MPGSQLRILRRPTKEKCEGKLIEIARRPLHRSDGTNPLQDGRDPVKPMNRKVTVPERIYSVAGPAASMNCLTTSRLLTLPSKLRGRAFISRKRLGTL